MKKILRSSAFIIVSYCVSFSLESCTADFDELNVSPNNPVNIAPQYLLPTGIESSVDRYWGHRNRFERINVDAAMLYMQYLTRNTYSNEGDDYSVSPALIANNWNGFFNDALINFQRIITQTNAESASPHSNYEGVALVMRSWVFSLLTDMYGPIPYQQALEGSAETAITKPVYDSMEDIYAGLINDLKTANEKLDPGGSSISGDILYNGDILKWKKFANSLRLRLANRQAAKKPAESTAIMSEIVSNPSVYPIFTSNADNAQLNCTGVLPSNNEWHEIMIRGTRTDWNIGKTFADRLNNLNDARIGIFANKNINGVYQGHPNGLPDALATIYFSTSSTIGDYFTRAEAPEVVMTYAELNFILAEAALDGEINGDAEAYFREGIQASFNQYNLTADEAYFDRVGPVTRPKILEQKWISLFGQGVEAWTEWRRTGYPVFPAHDPRAVLRNDGILPTRFPYPNSEFSLNRANVETAVIQLSNGNTMQSKLWWAEN